MADSTLTTTYKHKITFTMSMIEVGDTVKRTDTGKSDFSIGECGRVVSVSRDYENIAVRKSDGSISRGNAPHKLVVVSKRAYAHQKKTMVQKVNNFMKKFLDPKTQALVEAGYINGDLLPTEEGIDALQSILFFEHLDEVAALATSKIEKSKKTKRCTSSEDEDEDDE